MIIEDESELREEVEDILEVISLLNPKSTTIQPLRYFFHGVRIKKLTDYGLTLNYLRRAW